MKLTTEIQEAIGDSDVEDTAPRYKEKLIALDKLSADRTTQDRKGDKLLKLEVPTFDGNVSNWTLFWLSQFIIDLTFLIQKS